MLEIYFHNGKDKNLYSLILRIQYLLLLDLYDLRFHIQDKKNRSRYKIICGEMTYIQILRVLMFVLKGCYLKGSPRYEIYIVLYCQLLYESQITPQHIH